MTEVDFFKLLSKTGLPVTYYEFKHGAIPPLPYIVYYNDGIDTLFADNINYNNSDQMVVEVYCKNRSLKLEKEIHELFTNAHMGYAKSYFKNEDLQTYVIMYNVSI